MTELIMVIDVGTTNVKCALFNAQGNQLAVYKERCDSSENSERNSKKATQWWKSVFNNIKKISKKRRKAITAISITGQGPTIVPLNSETEQASISITWLDSSHSASVPESAKKELGPQLSGVLSKLLWLKDNIQGKHYLLQPADFIAYKLTGEVVNMSFDREGYLPWNQNMLREYGLAEMFSVPPLIPTGENIANISDELTNCLGMDRGTKVVSGAPDFVASLVGTGTVQDGYLCDRGGTSQGVTLCSSSKIEEEGLLTTPYFIKDFWKISGIMKTTGKAIDWFSSDIIDVRIGSKDIDMETIDRPTRIIFLPYLNGERSPHWNPDARGVFFGLDLDDDGEAMLVSVMEGIAFAIRDIIEMMERSESTISEIRTTGGQANNALLNQIKADVLGREINLPSLSESELLGTAIFALSGIMERSILALSEEIVEIKKTFTPNKKRYNKYSSLFEIYRDLYSQNVKTFQKISEFKDNEL